MSLAIPSPTAVQEISAEAALASPVLADVVTDSDTRLPRVGRIRIRGNSGLESGGSGEARVTRDQKRARLGSAVERGPSGNFTAGLIADSKRWLLRPAFDIYEKSAFAEETTGERKRTVAMAFDDEQPPVLTEPVTNNKADVLLAAYAPTEHFHGVKSPLAILLKGNSGANGRLLPPMTEGDHEWMREPLPEIVFSEPEQKCLATAIYFEARGESRKGQAAIAQVILNRVRNPSYPNNICGVVYQNHDWSNRCQFSFACDGVPDRIIDRRAYKLASEVALAVTEGRIFLRKVASSTHYFASYVSPSWAGAMEKMAQIGSHLFFRTYGGGWR